MALCVGRRAARPRGLRVRRSGRVVLRARSTPHAGSPDIANKDLATVQEALGDSWNRAGEFDKASDAYTAARRLVGADPLAEAALLLKRSRLEEKLGKYPQALRWAARARKALAGLTGPDAALQAARSSAWYATVLQAQGRNADAIRWADRAIAEAEAVGRPRRVGRRILREGVGVRRARQGGMGTAGAAFARCLPAIRRPGEAGGHPVERRRGMPGRGPLGRGDGLLRARPRRVSQDRRRVRRRGRAHERCRDPRRSRRIGRGRSDSAGVAASRGGRRSIAISSGIASRCSGVWRCAPVARTTRSAASRRPRPTSCTSARSRTLSRSTRESRSATSSRETPTPPSSWRSEHSPGRARRTRWRRWRRCSNACAARRCSSEGTSMARASAFEASLAAGRTRHDRFEVALTLLALIRLDRLEGAEPSPDVVGGEPRRCWRVSRSGACRTCHRFRASGDVKTGIHEERDAETYVTVLLSASSVPDVSSESSEIATYDAVAEVEDRRRIKDARQRCRGHRYRG